MAWRPPWASLSVTVTLPALSVVVVQLGGLSNAGAVSSKPGFFKRFGSAATPRVVKSRLADTYTAVAHAVNLCARQRRSLAAICVISPFPKDASGVTRAKQIGSAAIDFGLMG